MLGLWWFCAVDTLAAMVLSGVRGEHVVSLCFAVGACLCIWLTADAHDIPDEDWER